MNTSRNNQASDKRKKIESEHSSLFQKPSKTLCWGKRKVRDDEFSKDLQWKKMRIHDSSQPQISAGDANLKRTTEKTQGDHSLETRNTKIQDIRRPRMDLVSAGDANLERTTTEKIQGDHSRKTKNHDFRKPSKDLDLAGDASSKKTMTMPMNCPKPMHEPRIHKPSEKAQNQGSVKQTAAAAAAAVAERKGSMVASAAEEDDDWIMSKGLSGFVVPGPIPDFDSLGWIFDEDDYTSNPLSEFVIPPP